MEMNSGRFFFLRHFFFRMLYLLLTKVIIAFFKITHTDNNIFFHPHKTYILDIKYVTTHEDLTKKCLYRHFCYFHVNTQTNIYTDTSVTFM